MLKRNLTNKINSLLKLFPAVGILGARQCGKTTLAQSLEPVWYYLDLQNPQDFDRLTRDPVFFFEQHPTQLIIDEAQTYPPLFPILRGQIDQHRDEKNRFILTGSSQPELHKHLNESLAGRIAIVELGTLKANEQFQQPLSEFYHLFLQPLDKKYLPTQSPPLSRDAIQKAWLLGGYPEPVSATQPEFYLQWMQQYYDTYINRDIAALFPKLNRINYRRFIEMLASLSGTILNKSNLARALEIGESSIREYLSIAEGTFLWRNIPSFEKTAIKTTVKMPKGYIRDSGLLHHFLRIDTLDKLYKHPAVGLSFESFVIEELIKGLQALSITNWSVHYYRTRAGSEIDLIIEGLFGLLPIEIKYGSTVTTKQLQSMSRFIEENQLPFGLVINQSTSPEWLTPNIFQLPVGWL